MTPTKPPQQQQSYQQRRGEAFDSMLQSAREYDDKDENNSKLRVDGWYTMSCDVRALTDFDLTAAKGEQVQLVKVSSLKRFIRKIAFLVESSKIYGSFKSECFYPRHSSFCLKTNNIRFEILVGTSV